MNTRAVVAAFVLGTAPLAAQEPAMPRHQAMGDPMWMQEMMGPMMQVMLYTPQHLLARKDALGLTPDQVSRLTALRAATQTGQDAAMSEGKTHLQELEQAANAAAPDTGAMKTHFQPAQEAMGRAQWRGLAAAGARAAAPPGPQRAQL